MNPMQINANTQSQTHWAIQNMHLILHSNWAEAAVWVSKQYMSHERFSLSASVFSCLLGSGVSRDACGLHQKRAFVLSRSKFSWEINLIDYQGENWILVGSNGQRYDLAIKSPENLFSQSASEQEGPTWTHHFLLNSLSFGHFTVLSAFSWFYLSWKNRDVILMPDGAIFESKGDVMFIYVVRPLSIKSDTTTTAQISKHNYREILRICN